MQNISLDELNKKLFSLSGKDYQVATAEVLNFLATETSKEIKKSMKQKFILRNKYTENSLKIFKASKERVVSKQDSVVGSISPYLPYHEDGEAIKHNFYGKAKVAVSSQIASRGGNIKSVVLSKYRFNRMGRLGGTGGKIGSRGFFILKSKRTGASTIYNRIHTGRKSRLVALRSLHKEKRVKAKRFFNLSSDKVLKLSKVFERYSARIINILDN